MPYLTHYLHVNHSYFCKPARIYKNLHRLKTSNFAFNLSYWYSFQSHHERHHGNSACAHIRIGKHLPGQVAVKGSAPDPTHPNNFSQKESHKNSSHKNSHPQHATDLDFLERDVISTFESMPLFIQASHNIFFILK